MTDSKKQHGSVTPRNRKPEDPAGRGIHGLAGFEPVADESARLAITQIPEDRTRLIEQTGGTHPGYYIADGAGGWFYLGGTPNGSYSVSQHASRHEPGGDDEVNLPTLAHHLTHEPGGGDDILVLPDHHLTHEPGGGDDIMVLPEHHLTHQAGGVDEVFLDQTLASITLYVDDATGDDANDGSSTHPLKTLTEAMDRVPLQILHPVRIFVANHTGTGYTWTPLTKKLLNQNIYVHGGWLLWNGTVWEEDPLHPGKTELVASVAALSGSSTSVVKCSDAIEGMQGATIEILTGAAAGNRRTIKLPITSAAWWRSVASDADGSVLIAAAWNGRLYLSVDSGVTWVEKQPAGNVDALWSCVASDADGSVLVAATLIGAVYVSTNSGSTWTSRVPSGANAESTWAAIACSANGSNLILCATGGRVWTSTNSGTNWTERRPTGIDENKYWRCLSSDLDGSVLMVAEYAPHTWSASSGKIYRSSDSGVTWAEIQPAGATTKTWTALACDATGNTLVAACSFGWAEKGFVYVSVNGGVNWTLRTPQGTDYADWSAVASNSDGTKLVAVCLGAGSSWPQNNGVGRIYTSTDSGATWTLRSPTASPRMWNSVASSSTGSNLVVCGWDGLVYFSSDSGATWLSYTSTSRNILPTSPFTAAVSAGDLFRIFEPSVKIKALADFGKPGCGSNGLWFINFLMDYHTTVDPYGTYCEITLSNANIKMSGVQATGPYLYGGHWFSGSNGDGGQNRIAFGSGTPSIDLKVAAASNWSGWGYSTDRTNANSGVYFFGDIYVSGYIVSHYWVSGGADTGVIIKLSGGSALSIGNVNGCAGFGGVIGVGGEHPGKFVSIRSNAATPFVIKSNWSSIAGGMGAVHIIGDIILENVVIIQYNAHHWWEAPQAIIHANGELTLLDVTAIATEVGVLQAFDSTTYLMAGKKIKGLGADVGLGKFSPSYYGMKDFGYNSYKFGNVDTDRLVAFYRPLDPP